MKDVIIIGSGPAGVSASLYTARAGLDTTIVSLDNSALHKAELIQNYYGFSEAISGTKLSQDAILGAKSVGVKFISKEVIAIDYDGDFVVSTPTEQYKTKNVLLATGTARNTPKNLGIENFEGKGVSYCAICDAFFYRSKNVAVLGSGEFALHEAETLLPIANSVTILTNGTELSPELKKIESENSSGVAIDKSNYIFNKNVISKVVGDNQIEKVLFVDETSIDIDGLFVAYGIAGITSFAKKIGAIMEGGKIVIDENMATNVPGLFAAGDCTGGLLQVAKAVYEGATAGLAIVKHRKTQS